MYVIWHGMIARCTNPNAPAFADYGGRGITVCDRWRESLGAFVEDMGERPPGKSIDRVDNDGPYSPGNCRWATPLEQARNRRVAINVTAFGETMTIEDWAPRFGVRYQTIYFRIKNGWPPQEAVSLPVGTHRNFRDPRFRSRPGLAPTRQSL